MSTTLCIKTLNMTTQVGGYNGDLDGNENYDSRLEEYLNCPQTRQESIIGDRSHTWPGYLVKYLLVFPAIRITELYNTLKNNVLNNEEATKNHFFGMFGMHYFDIPRRLIQDFYRERMPTYYDNVANYLTNYYMDMVFSSNLERKHYLPSYERLLQMMTSGSTSSEGLKYQDESQIIFEIPGIKRFSAELFKGFHFSITGARVDLLERKITFLSCMEESECYYYDVTSPLYHFAVADFVNGVSTSTVYYVHPKSHFHSTDLFAYACLKTKEASNLNRILCHHSRHTLFLNDDVLRSTKLPLENHDSLFANYLYPFATLPMTSNSLATLTSERLVGKCLGIPTFNQYSKFDRILQGYFDITRDFVSNIKGLLETEELEGLSNIIKEENIELCDDVDIYDILATFIYKASFYHSTDHYTAYMLFTYGELLSQKYFPDTLIQNNIPIKDLPGTNPTMRNLNYGPLVCKELNETAQSFVNNFVNYERLLAQTGDILAPLTMIAPSVSF